MYSGCLKQRTMIIKKHDNLLYSFICDGKVEIRSYLRYVMEKGVRMVEKMAVRDVWWLSRRGVDVWANLSHCLQPSDALLQM